MNTPSPYEGVAPAFHGVNHTMGGYPRTSKPCHWYKIIYVLPSAFG